MTDQAIPADDLREIIGKMRYHANHDNVRGTEEEYIRFFASQLETLLPAPFTMADMTEEERHDCQWMQCDAGPYGRRGLILDTGEWDVYVADKETGAYSNYSPDLVTARPDLPRVEWSGTEKDANTAKIGTVIESSNDPRLAALPIGSVLLDRDNDPVIKQDGPWEGAGYYPDEGDDLGPWKVAYVPKEADQ